MLGFRSLLRSLPVLTGALVLACQSDSGDSDGMGGEGGGGGAASVDRAQRTLGQDGGELATSNTTLFVPSGALEKSTEITVKDLDADEVEDLPETTEGVKLVGFPSKFTPHGLTFEQPVDVGLSYPPPDDEDTPIVAMKLENDQDTTWEVIPGAKFESGTASFKIDSFSIYACFEDPNGIAEMLYGPEVSGSGGSGSGGGDGSGGDGSGGDGSGGDGSGGATGGSGGATGGSGGATGGSGGSGGGSSLFGYLDTGTLKGFGYSEQGVGATITTDLETAPAPNCATGTTGDTMEGSAGIFYYVNQTTENLEQELVVPDGGLRFGAAMEIYRSMVIELREYEGPGVWCAHYANEAGNTEFFPWSSFDAINCPGGEISDPFDPLTDGLTKIAIKVPSNQEFAENFDFCITELDAGLPLGYMNGPTWSGYGWYTSDGVSTLDSDVEEELAPNCITGTTVADLNGYVELGYNLNEPVTYGATPVLVPGIGLELDVVTSSTRDLVVRLMNATDGLFYCAPINQADTGSFGVLWEEFLECDSGGPFSPGDTLIDAISVRVKSTGVSEPYDFCLDRLEADIPIGQ